jgi:hypothetical protein
VTDVQEIEAAIGTHEALRSASETIGNRHCLVERHRARRLSIVASARAQARDGLRLALPAFAKRLQELRRWAKNCCGATLHDDHAPGRCASDAASAACRPG